MSRTGEDTNSPDFPYENYVFRGCAPGRTRTFDLRIRNPLLYPAELRAQKLCNMSPLSLEKSRMNAEWLKVRKLQGRFGLKIDHSLRRLPLAVSRATYCCLARFSMYLTTSPAVGTFST